MHDSESTIPFQSRDSSHDSAGNRRPPGRRPLNAFWPLLGLFGIVGLAVALSGRRVPPNPGPIAPTGRVEPQAVKAPSAEVDPLPSWHEGPTKTAILEFLEKVTRDGSDSFVPPPERVAVFDHDGTLVCEKPIVHGAYLIERVREVVAKNPDLAHEEPYATLLSGDLDFVRKLGKKFFADISFALLAGASEEELEDDVRDFLEQARHPVFDVPYGDTTFQPMHELIGLLRARGFSIWICSGSGVHFMRPAAAAWYGIGPEHVIASRSTTVMQEMESDDAAASGSPNRRLGLVVQPELAVLNDQERKPISIGEQIGRRPIFAAGNVGTGGDIAMLRWSQSHSRPNLQLLVLHDDAEREMAYGEPTNASLKAAEQYGWQVVRMAQDWKRLFSQPLVKRTPPASPATPAPAPAEPILETNEEATKALGPEPALGDEKAARWEKDVAAYEAADREQPPAVGGIVLVGSSNIRLWTTLAEDFPGLNVLNRGVGGARLEELVGFAPRLAISAKPAAIVVSAGTNDIGGGATAAEVCGSFERLVEAVRKDLPDTTIAFLAISPTPKRWDQLDRQKEANEAIRAFIESGRVSGLRFLDANAAFLGPDGTPDPACFIEDQQHPSRIGYSRRAEILRPLFEELVPRR